MATKDLRAPKGPVAEEANLAALSDGSLYATYRTIDGYNCQAYSRDGGHTWTPPEYATYGPDGLAHQASARGQLCQEVLQRQIPSLVSQPRRRGGLATKWDYYSNRNPAWVAGGIERDGHIYWSEPEILLYDLDPTVKMSYPDFIEDRGRFFVTETQKTIARVHEIDRTLLEGLWSQQEVKTVARQGLSLEHNGAPGPIEMPRLPDLSTGGFSIDFWIKLRELSSGQVLLDARDLSGRGIAIVTTDRFTLQILLSDGKAKSAWDSDPGTQPGTLRAGAWQHVAVIVDGGPKIVTWVVDGVLNDGGPVRDFGWGRFDPQLRDVNGSATAKLAPVLYGELLDFRIYNRYLRTSEAVGNSRARL